MKLYRIAGHAWVGTQGDAKKLAREQHSAWQPVEVPTDKPGLIAWLNDEGRVIPATEPEILDPTEDRRTEIGGTEAGAVLSSADVDRVNAGRPAFLPRLDADEIERRRMAMNQCPKCGTSNAPLLTVEDVERWIAAGQLDDLERIGHAIKDRCVADRRSLEAGGIQ